MGDCKGLRDIDIAIFYITNFMLQVEIDQNLAKFKNVMTLFDLQWLKLTFKQQNLYIFGISEQFAIRKITISIFRAT
jgi:hypothetical protein